MIGWVDIETTGLEPRGDDILELAIVVTSDDLEPLMTYESIVRFAKPPEMWPSFVLDMHRESGLLEAIENGEGKSLIEVEDDAVRMLDAVATVTEQERGQLIMGGSSVHFDRAFLKHHMPTLHDWFHYRNIDVSTLKELAQRWTDDGSQVRTIAEMTPVKPHRALNDIVSTINMLTGFRNIGFVGMDLPAIAEKERAEEDAASAT